MSEKHANPYKVTLTVNPNGFANAQDDAEETIRGTRDHDKAHGIGMFSELTFGMECHRYRGAGR